MAQNPNNPNNINERVARAMIRLEEFEKEFDSLKDEDKNKAKMDEVVYKIGEFWKEFIPLIKELPSDYVFLELSRIVMKCIKEFRNWGMEGRGDLIDTLDKKLTEGFCLLAIETNLKVYREYKELQQEIKEEKNNNNNNQN